jgi:hypothetical protein
MKTYPDMDYRQHIKRLLEQLLHFFPSLEEDQLLFYDSTNDEMNFIRRSKFLASKDFKILLYRLCEEGREWINLAGDSWYEQHFLVTVEYSSKQDMSMTAINVSGPSLDTDGNPLKSTRLKVIEDVSNDL